MLLPCVICKGLPLSIVLYKRFPVMHNDTIVPILDLLLYNWVLMNCFIHLISHQHNKKCYLTSWIDEDHTNNQFKFLNLTFEDHVLKKAHKCNKNLKRTRGTMERI